MHAYDIALFVHMLGLVTLFGGFAINVRTGARLRAATSVDQVRTWLSLFDASRRMFPTGLGLLLLSGLYMTFERWQAPHPWIIVPVIAVIILGALGGGVVDRRLRALATAAKSRDTAPETLTRLVADPVLWTVMTALNGLAVGVVWVMSTKPGWVGSVGAVVVTAAIGAAVGSRLARGDQWVGELREHATPS